MNVLLISQCDKRALTETRRILDQFAERRGDRTWQTPITQAGLDTLRRLLKKTARKNTAVACHWIRGRDHSELMWLVGDASRFNIQGAVPTNTTNRDVLRRSDENDWHTGEDIYLFSALAALLHDLGKACDAFQRRLLPDAALERNLYRHEWVSLRLFQAFVGADKDDATWLARLAKPDAEDDASWLQHLQRDGLDKEAKADFPFKNMPPLAQAIAWLVVTHHRLPVMPCQKENDQWNWLGAKVPGFRTDRLRDLPGSITANWNETCDEIDADKVKPYWHFPYGLPVTTPQWRKRASHLAERFLKRLCARGAGDWLDNPYLMHLSRLTLMLADHYYSTLTDPSDRLQEGEKNYPLFANTNRKTGERNQTLDEHLLGVELHSGKVSHALPGFEQHLPRLARHRGLRKRSEDPRFRWQDKAADVAAAMRKRAAEQGAFMVNMASTGCGKTLANARIMYALADPERGMRCSFALGLRTLTLQTGSAYRDLLQLGDDDLAIRVGGGASRELFEFRQAEAEASGSASTQSLLPEDGYVRFDGNAEAHPVLKRVMHDPQVMALLSAPVLVCTVDHLTPATESQRGGHQIAPMLRLMSSDLVLDEPDDFDLADLPALTRLVHWAGMLGSRVLLSSATLPPSLIQGLFAAYRDGRAIYQRNRGEPGRLLNICCAWFDEHDQQQRNCADTEIFQEAHNEFAKQRHNRLSKAVVRRRTELVPLSFSSKNRDVIRQEFAHKIHECALRLHQQHHSLDPGSGKRVSFGLVRMANIEPLFDVALALYKLGASEGSRIHLCVYHSQHPLLIRSAIERRLDQALDRRKPEAVFDLPDIRKHLDAHDEADHLFIVLGSPVTEVGRDHDYDWAVVEPSSMRSLIQLAGRVRRHRLVACETTNILLFNSNLRHFEKGGGEPAFCKPGFESSDFRLNSHCLENLLFEEERNAIDARPRILARAELKPRDNLVDLEHFRLQKCMLDEDSSATLTPRQLRAMQQPLAPALSANTWWKMPRVMLTAVLPQQQPFREDNQKRVELVLLPDPDKGEEDYLLSRIDPGKRRYESVYVPVETSLNHRISDGELNGPRIQAWGESDYMEALAALAGELDMSLSDCARRFGTVSLPESTNGWRFHPVLGFAKCR